MKRLLALILVVCCLFVCVPASAYEYTKNDAIAAAVQAMNNQALQLIGLEAYACRVAYIETSDIFYIEYKSETITEHAERAARDDESDWHIYKAYAYDNLLSATKTISVLRDDELPHVVLCYVSSNDGELTGTPFYTLELKRGWNVEVTDEITHDTYPFTIN